MKNTLFSISATAVILILSGCGKEQSELTLESVSGRATIQGEIKYVVGDYRTPDNVIISDYQLPAASRTVMVSFMTSDLVEGSEGKQYFTATTDAEGRYSIDIPVGSQTVNATVTVLPFHAEKHIGTGGLSIATISDALYNKVVDKNISISQQKIFTADLVVSSDATLGVSLDQEVEIKGKVEVQAWVPDKYNSDNWKGGSEPYRTPLIVTANVGSTVIKVGTESESSGEYSLKMMLPTNCWTQSTTITVSTEVCKGNFTHRYQNQYTWLMQSVDVVYNQASSTAALTENQKLKPLNMDDILITTDPVEREEVFGIGNDIDDQNGIRYNNPFYW